LRRARPQLLEHRSRSRCALRRRGRPSPRTAGSPR
jgi:hypothetical protein